MEIDNFMCIGDFMNLKRVDLVTRNAYGEIKL